MQTPGALVGGRYRLSQRIGHGRGGFVWIAQDTTVHRTVAVKPRTVDPATTSTAGPTPVAVAVQLARHATKLKHPAAVPVYDVIVEPETVWLVTEYVPSRSMAEFLAGHGTLGAADTANLGGQLASALAAAHRMDLKHQAVEPANVLLADDGGVQITDFGIGTLQPDAAYQAPETIAGGVATTASDVFSLGATLFFAVRGTLPFGPHGVDTGPLLDTRDTHTAGDSGLNQVLTRMLSADPASRPAMAGVATALDAVTAARPIDPDDIAAAGTPADHPGDVDEPEPHSLSGTLPVGEGDTRPPAPPQVATLPTTTTPTSAHHPTIPTSPGALSTQPTTPTSHTTTPQTPQSPQPSGPLPAQSTTQPTVPAATHTTTQPTTPTSHTTTPQTPQQPTPTAYYPHSGPLPAQSTAHHPGSGPQPTPQVPPSAAAPRNASAATATADSRGSSTLRFLLLIAAVLAAAVAGVVFTELVLL